MINEYEINLSFKTLFQAFFQFYNQKHRQKLENLFGSWFKSNIYSTGSGSDSLLIILKDIEKKKGKGEIICPNYSCKAIPRTIIKAGFKPVFVDINSRISLDLKQVKKAVSDKTKAILIYHPWGFMHDKNIFYFCKKKKILCIEDCARGMGGIKGKRFGSFGDYSFFSFRTGKLINAGSGSIIISKEKLNINLRKYPKILSLVNLLDLFLRKIKNLPKLKAIFDYLFDSIDQYQIGNMECFLILNYLEKIKQIEQNRTRNYGELKKIFVNIKFNECSPIPLSFPLFLENRGKWEKIFKSQEVNARAYYCHVNSNEFKKFKYFGDEMSKKVAKQILNLPVHELLGKKEINQIKKILQNVKNSN